MPAAESIPFVNEITGSLVHGNLKSRHRLLERSGLLCKWSSCDTGQKSNWMKHCEHLKDTSKRGVEQKHFKTAEIAKTSDPRSDVVGVCFHARNTCSFVRLVKTYKWGVGQMGCEDSCLSGRKTAKFLVPHSCQMFWGKMWHKIVNFCLENVGGDPFLCIHS